MRQFLLSACVILLLSGLAEASSHKRLDSLAIAAYDLCNRNRAGTPQIADSVVYTYVNLSTQQVSTDFPAIQKSKALVCSDGVSAYAVGDTAFDRLVWCRIWKSKDTTKIYPLKVVSALRVFETIQEGRAEPGVLDEPGYVYAWGDSVFVSPVPGHADTLMIGYTVVDDKLLAADSTTEIIPRYRHLIVYLTAWHICIDLSLYTKAAEIMKEYDKALKERWNDQE